MSLWRVGRAGAIKREGRGQRPGDASLPSSCCAYACGVFPMADARDDRELFLVDPERRGILPLDGFHVPRRLARTVRASPSRSASTPPSPTVVAACAEPRPAARDLDQPPDRPALPRAAPSSATPIASSAGRTASWSAGSTASSLGGAFFGESMFCRRRDASKVALVRLVARLLAGGFRLLDTQFMTEHLASSARSRSAAPPTTAAAGDAVAAGALSWRCPPTPRVSRCCSSAPRRRSAVVERRERRRRGEHPAG